MSNKPPKRKADKDLGPRSRKRKRQLILSPRNVQPVLSDTSTIPMDITDRDEETLNGTPIGAVTIEDDTLLEMEEDGLLESGSEESEMEDDELGRKPTDPMRLDMPIVTSRWQEEEVDALMVALNVNRDAIKFHFDGPGGGRDVKRQGWRDVAAYVNSVANTHRTVQQCVNKTDDYTQRVKGKYNKLRYAISQTGKGKIKKTLKLKDTEGKALDYLREEAVKESHSEVKRFTANGSDYFKILHTDTLSDSIIVGARNMVYNISLTKSRQLKVNKHIAWKSEDHIVRLCRSRRKSAEDCQNYIRLVVNQTSSDLFVCGTNAFKPECRVYRSIPGTYEEIDNASGVAICPYDPHQNNTYTHAGGSLYTATIADANGRDSLIYRNPTRTVQHDSQMLNDPDFVSSFEYEDNVYFFFREFAVEYINCGKAIYSRVGRVCKKDRGGGIILRDIWTSFFKVRLNCSIPGDFPFYFDEIQSTSILGSGHFKPTMDPSNRTDMIYAVFNTPENSISGSAVCAFLMSDVIAAFEGGFKEQKSVYSTWLAVNEQDTPKPHPAMCVNDSKELPIQTVNFIKSHPLMDRAVAAQGNRPILIQTSITSRMTQIAVDWQRQAVDGKAYDVLFIGKNDGTVLKAINRGTGSKIDTVIIEEIRVFAPGQAVTGLQVYRSQKEGQELIENLIVVSRSEIKTIPLHRCGQQSTCGSCVALRDPYCSWDQNRCRANTLHGEQNIDKGTGCLDEKTAGGENVIASSSSASAPTSTPCVCPEQRVVVHPTVDAQRGTSTTTENKDANRVVDPADAARGDENSIPNVGLQRKDPEVGASTQVRGDTVSASTLAISLVFSILIALIVGFVAGYRTSVYRHKEGQDDFFSMRSPKAEGLKNLNRFDSDSNRYNTHDYLPQPRTEKQLNVVFNPLKPNSKLPNGSAQTEVQKQKAKKVYL